MTMNIKSALASYHTAIMTNLLLFLILQVTAVASFTTPPKFQNNVHPCHAHHNKHNDQADTTKSIFSISNVSVLHYSLTADDWHTAAQLHPLDDLGVDDESSSSIMMMGLTARDASGAASAMSASHHSPPAAAAEAATGDDMTREIMEAFFPVILLVLLEIYSQQILQFPLA